MKFRWGVLTKASNDKGPFKLGIFEVDGKSDIVALIFEPYGLQASALVGSSAAIFYPDCDEGRALAFVMAPPAKRIDGQAEGESSFANLDTGNVLKHDKDGNSVLTSQQDIDLTAGAEVKITSTGDTIVKTTGLFHVNPP